ncbi:MAG: hypothetical protein R3253_08945, partial [Longimicrobiales bacterium]|nr:hypothetical protein [Longimicrobiales bacterium]
PDIYQRDRSAVRMEPFLAVRGRLQKDGDTLNVIAYELEALRVPGAPVRRRGLSRAYPASRNRRTAATSLQGAQAAVRERSPSAPAEDLAAFHASLPDPLEYWADTDKHQTDPYQYLTALRQNAPDAKSFG